MIILYQNEKDLASGCYFKVFFRKMVGLFGVGSTVKTQVYPAGKTLTGTVVSKETKQIKRNLWRTIVQIAPE